MGRLLVWFGLLALLLGRAPTASAQTTTPAVPTAVTLTIIAATGDPVTLPAIASQTTAISAAAVVCNQAPSNPVAGVPVNPSVFAVDDPFTAGRECRVAGPLGLPNGTFRAVSTFSGTCTAGPCTSARSVVALPGPFLIQGTIGPPSAPQDLHIP